MPFEVILQCAIEVSLQYDFEASLQYDFQVSLHYESTFSLQCALCSSFAIVILQASLQCDTEVSSAV